MSDDPYAPFEALLEQDPDDAMLLYGLGRKLLTDGHPARAEPHLAHCVEVDPGYSFGGKTTLRLTTKAKSGDLPKQGRILLEIYSTRTRHKSYFTLVDLGRSGGR